jgi:4-amino-4-deoxy-L-arabinose transferase-like glycosyltransferase
MRVPPPPATPPAPGCTVWRGWMPILLIAHAVLVLWGVFRNSVTFDESYHVTSGVLIVARQDYHVSPVNPPLVKALSGACALLAGARLPREDQLKSDNHRIVAYGFMSANADRFHRVYAAARLPVVALSLLLALLVWWWAGRLYGPAGGVIALAFYAFSPDALAHGGLATMEVGTALGFLATLLGWWGFLGKGGWRWFATAAAGFAFLVLTRFTAWSLIPILMAATLGAMWVRYARRPALAWIGILGIVVVGLAALQVGYLGGTTFVPIGEGNFHSHAFSRLAHAWPGLRLPLPDWYVRGFDHQTMESEGNTPTFVLGRLTDAGVWWYFPLAMLVKWPLAFLAGLVLRAVARPTSPADSPRRHEWLFLLLPCGVFLAAGMTLVRLNSGVRYMFPLVPLLCVWLGGLAASRIRSRRLLAAGVGLAVLAGAETLTAAPWYLTFFNRFAGGPGRGDSIVNDSNVDWGQGLIALREEMKRRGIQRVYLSYHGTVDPAIYGIDYVPYAGGDLGNECDWLAVSSYFLHGLPQRLVTSRGISSQIRIDFSNWQKRLPDARPANCMVLYRLH